jgi:hydroxypyruvate reductase
MRGAPAVLLAVRTPDGFRERLAARFEVLVPAPGSFPQAVAAMPRADAERVRVIVTYGTLDTSAAAFDRLPALRLVCCLGSGYEGVDLAAARARGIVVTNSPGANTAAVADLAVGLMVASIRRIAEGDAYVRRGDWGVRGTKRSLQMRGLTGRRVGVWGLGAIGAKIAARCEAFEMEVAYHGRAPRAGARYAYHATLEGLAHWADVLMIAVRAGPGNRHAVDARVLAALGAGGHVVNITRGSVIDETALIAALRDGVIAGAGLDVFEREPDVPFGLRALRNVVMTPHLGGNTDEAQAAMHDAVLANIDAWIAGRPVHSPVPGSESTAPVAAG